MKILKIKSNEEYTSIYAENNIRVDIKKTATVRNLFFISIYQNDTIEGNAHVEGKNYLSMINNALACAEEIIYLVNKRSMAYYIHTHTKDSRYERY